METEVCSHFSSGVKKVCDSLALFAPKFFAGRMVQRFTITGVCDDLKFCNSTVTTEKDLQPINRYSINMDLAPADRWKDLCAMPHVAEYWVSFINILKEVLPSDVYDGVEDTGREVWKVIDQIYAQEIQGCATQIFKGQPEVLYGWMTLLNLGYELSDACTSIVTQSVSGDQIFHARNLDFGVGWHLTATMKNLSAIVDMKKGGKVVATQTAYIGFVGVLSGQKPGGFTITVNTRFQPGKNAITALITEAIDALREFPNANLVAFLSRDALMHASNFEEAVKMLSTQDIVADVYYTISGINKNEGAVITRNQTGAVNVMRLGDNAHAHDSWFLIQTNYDNWKAPPFFDNRRDPGIEAMYNMGQENISLDALLKVLSTRPVLNMLTTYSLTAINNNSTYTSTLRYCQFPCSL